MRRAVLVAAALGVAIVSPARSVADEARPPEVTRAGPDDGAREVTALKRDVDRLRTELVAMRKQVEELKKAQSEMKPNVEMLLSHRHQLFLDSIRGEALFPQTKGTYFVTTPSPDNLAKTSGPVAAPK